MGGISCGSQVTVCEYPIHFDTYKGCSHGCRYCFAQTKVNLSEIKISNCYESLKLFINGSRTRVTNWCDWDIPLHWGGVSDPFQPLERESGISLKCLRLLCETQYPFIVSTKGALVAEEPYLSLLAKSNAVVQLSMVCDSYDVLEKGAPTYQQRLKMLEILSAKCKRVVVRVQPYMREIRKELIDNIPKIKKAGAYGITIEGMKFKSKKAGLVKAGGDFCYQEKDLRKDYLAIREECEKNSIAFFCAENRLRKMGESTSCCGCGDLEGFAGNKFNAVNLVNGENIKPSERMKECGTADCFKGIHQTSVASRSLKKVSFAAQMLEEAIKINAPK